MPTKSFNPITKSRRYITVLDYSELTRTTPQKSLTKGKKSTGGRNSAGRITTRFRGNGNKRRYRMIDFKRTKDGVPAVRTAPLSSPFWRMRTARRATSSLRKV